MIRKLLIINLFIINTLVLIHSEFYENYNYTFSVDKFVNIFIYNHNGSVEVTTWHKEKIDLYAKKVSWSWEGKKELRQADLLVNKIDQNNLEIKTVYNNNIDVDKIAFYIEIQIPKTARVNVIQLEMGDISIERSAGGNEQLKLYTSKGNIKARYINSPLDVKTGSGDILIEKIHGFVKAETSAGSIEFYDSFGGGDIINSKGNIEIGDIKGTVKVKNDIGKIDAYEINGNVDIKNINGDISVDDIIGDVTAETSMGNIKISYIKGFVKISSNNGNIYTDEIKGINDIQNNKGNIETQVLSINENGSSIINNSGTVKIYLSNKLDANLEIECLQGNLYIESYFRDLIKKSDINKIIKLGKGGPKLFIKSSTGKIRIYEY
jgi:hypothetical protein